MLLQQFGPKVALVAIIVIDAALVLATIPAATWVARRIRWLPDQVLDYFTGEKDHTSVPWVLGALTGLVMELPRFGLVFLVVGSSFRGDLLGTFAAFRIVGVPWLVVAGFLAGSVVANKEKANTGDEAETQGPLASTESATAPETMPGQKPVALPPPTFAEVKLGWISFPFALMNGFFVTYIFNPYAETQMKWGAAVLVFGTARVVIPGVLSLASVRTSQLARIVGLTTVVAWLAGLFIGRGLIPKREGAFFDTEVDLGEWLGSADGLIGLALFGGLACVLIFLSIRAWKQPTPPLPAWATDVSLAPTPAAPTPAAPTPAAPTPAAPTPAAPTPARPTPEPTASVPTVAPATREREHAPLVGPAPAASPPPTAQPAPPSARKKPVPATPPAPQPDTWRVAQFSSTAKPSRRTIQRRFGPAQIAMGVLVLGVVAGSAYALGRGGSDPVRATAEDQLPIDQAAEPIPLETTETVVEPVPVETVIAAPQLFPTHANSNLIPLPGCMVEIYFEWRFDPAEAPSRNNVATVRVRGPRVGGFHEADYKKGLAKLTLQTSNQGGGRWVGSLISIGAADVYKTPMLVTSASC